jgi:reactive intermediate/imine deaminase
MPELLFHMIPGAPKPVAPYTHIVECDGWLFVTGQVATDPDDDTLPPPAGIVAQTHKVMDNLIRVLKGAQVDLSHVVTVRAFLTAFERDYETFNQIYATYFPPDRLPARTTVGVTGLARRTILEIDMIALR